VHASHERRPGALLCGHRGAVHRHVLRPVEQAEQQHREPEQEQARRRGDGDAKHRVARAGDERGGAAAGEPHEQRRQQGTEQAAGGTGEQDVAELTFGGRHPIGELRKAC